MEDKTYIAIGVRTDTGSGVPFESEHIVAVPVGGGGSAVGPIIDTGQYTQLSMAFIATAAANAGGKVQLQESVDGVMFTDLVASATLTAAGTSVVHSAAFAKYIRATIEAGSGGTDSITGVALVHLKGA
tara:strand:- start:16341 stop:16727 length:387 start_codon:yes stop_codon:yes gene_type:complete